MYKSILALMFIAIIYACGQNDAENKVVEEINALKTVAQQKAYLKMIYDEDQGIRKKLNTLREQYGQGSESIEAAYEQMRMIDKINIERIEYYLDIYGHPQKDIHGSDACFVPTIVIHHSPHGFKHRKKHFKIFYKAYLEGDNESLDMYLTRMYYERNNGHLNIEGPYTEEFEIDTLIRSMGLDVLRDEVMAGG